MVGVYLVFSSLIMPALAVRHLTQEKTVAPRALVVAYTLGALAYALGLTLSAMLDWPSGAVVVVVMAGVCVLASQWMPKPSGAAEQPSALANLSTPPT
jgi:zinc/manganese transport system permease protein